jgi:hypothetical protein
MLMPIVGLSGVWMLGAPNLDGAWIFLLLAFLIMLSVPGLIIIAIFAPIMHLVERRRQNALRHRGCSKCGYDVRNSTRQCPACGSPIVRN